MRKPASQRMLSAVLSLGGRAKGDKAVPYLDPGVE
jgi:hypothetical protein